jgi:hypothetical protein
MLTRLGATLALAAAMILLTSPAARADDPVDLDGAYVLDRAQVVTGETARIQTALDSLYERARIQLIVVYVDTFDNPSDPVEWADTTAIANGLGEDDLLLAVAVDDRQYALSIGPGFTLTDAQLDDAELAIEERLRDNRWADAAIAGAQSLEASATGVVGPNVPAEAPGVPILPILGGIAVVVVAAIVILVVIRRRRGTDAAAPEKLTQKQLDQRAGSLLVQLDDSIKTSEQELGFAIAQFGDEATADFTAALASAKATVAQAFQIKQRLDDATADSADDRRAWTREVIRLCEVADAELDAQADAFDALRALEKNAPEALAAIGTAIDGAAARVEAATLALAQLRSGYAPGAVAPVAANLEHASKLLAFAESARTEARTAIDAGRPSEAAVAVRGAQASVGQALSLFDAIDRLGSDLHEASGRLDDLLVDTRSDLVQAHALPQDDASAPLAPAIAVAESALSAAEELRTDPVAALAELGRANVGLEQVFVGVRERQANIAAARNRLAAALIGARTELTSATEFITTRRGGIGETARTRLSEADRQLNEAEALADGDPIAALARASQAGELASSALELAQRDVQSFQTGSTYGGGYGNGGDGADLGGLLGGWLGSGGGGGSGGGRSSWSGSSRRSSGTRSTRSGSFGGSSRSSSRGSGGRRSRGGRF